MATTTKVATAWGPADVLEEVSLLQRVGEKRFSAIVQLLEGPKGEHFVRFAYGTGGSVRRGPLTLRARDVARLRAALAERPGLASALGLGGDA